MGETNGNKKEKGIRNREFEDFWKSCEESEDLKELCRKRTEYSLRWYTKKAVKYKTLFYLFSIINITAPLLSGAVISCFGWKCGGVLLAALASSAAAFLALFDAKAKWNTYRTAAEYIKSQYTLYLAGIEKYDDGHPEETYLCMLEEYMQNVHNHWLAMQKNKEEKKS